MKKFKSKLFLVIGFIFLIDFLILTPRLFVFAEDKEPDKEESAKKEPAKKEPAKKESAKKESAKKESAKKESAKKEQDEELTEDEDGSLAEGVPEGVELVNMSFPEPTEIKDIIKAVSMWEGKNVILDRSVTGKIQILSPRNTTKEEAYQIFLEALNVLGFTTVETGKVIKIMKHANAKRDNLPTYHGNSWAPKTGEYITQVVPLKYVLAKDVSLILSRMFPTNSIIAYEPTNTLIISDTGNQIQRILDILALLDVQKQQPKIMIVPIKYSDPKTVADKVKEILKGSSGTLKSAGSYNSFKILIDERTNSVIIFGPPRTLNDIKRLVKTFDIEVEDPTMEASIHVRPLDYADAKQLSSTLSSLTQSGKKSGAKKFGSDLYSPPSTVSSSTASAAALSDGVKITADEATNSLIITGSRAAYNALNVIIRKLDKQRSQVYIEADIIEITSKDEFNFGTSVFGAAGNMENDKSIGSIFGFEAGAGATGLMGAQALAASTTGNNVSTNALKLIKDTFSSDLKVGLLGPAIKIPGIGEKIRPGLLINILKTDGNSKVLQSPQILTQNNADATIVVGERRIYKTESLNSSTGAIATKVEKENVDLTLTIKPHISSYSDYVTLNIDLDANNVTGISANGAPEIAKKKTKQLVTVKNNQTIVISGLLSQSEQEAYSKVPLLGDIPLIGMLFRKSKTLKSQKNLIMFITPHVIHGPGDLAAIYKAKVEERDNFLKNVYGKSALKDDFYRLIPSQKHGIYEPTEQDKIEDERRERERQETLKIMGYTKEEEKKMRPRSPFKAPIERTVPITIDPSSGTDTPPPAATDEKKKP